MIRGLLTDGEWALLAPFVVVEAGAARGRPPRDHRRTLDAVFWIARTGAGQQLERLTEAYLAGVVPLAEYERRRRDTDARLQALDRQEHELTHEAERQGETAGLAAHAEAFCRRVREGLAAADFSRKRALLELLVDRVVVADGAVEIRYAVPIGPDGEREPFCRLRSDYRVPHRPPEEQPPRRHPLRPHRIQLPRLRPARLHQAMDALCPRGLVQLGKAALPQGRTTCRGTAGHGSGAGCCRRGRGSAAAGAKSRHDGHRPGQRPKSDRLAPKVLALVAQGRSHRLIGREVGLSKNTVADIVKRSRAHEAPR